MDNLGGLRGLTRAGALQEALDEMDGYVLKLVSDRRLSLEAGEAGSNDMLNMLLKTRFEGGEGFSDREIRDELVSGPTLSPTCSPCGVCQDWCAVAASIEDSHHPPLPIWYAVAACIEHAHWVTTSGPCPHRL